MNDVTFLDILLIMFSLYKICSISPNYDEVFTNDHDIAFKCVGYLEKMTKVSHEKGYTDIKGEVNLYKKLLTFIESELEKISEINSNYGFLKYQQFHINSLNLWDEKVLICGKDTSSDEKNKALFEVEKKYEKLLLDLCEFEKSLNKSILVSFIKFEVSKLNYRIHNIKITRFNHLSGKSAAENDEKKQLLKDAEKYLFEALEINEDIKNDELTNTLKDILPHFLSLNRKSRTVLQGSYRFIYEKQKKYEDAVRVCLTALVEKKELQKTFPEEVNDKSIGISYYQLSYDLKNYMQPSRALLCTREAQKIFNKNKGFDSQLNDLFNQSKQTTSKIINFENSESESLNIEKGHKSFEAIKPNLQERDMDDVDSIIFSFNPEYYHYEIDCEGKCINTLKQSMYDSRFPDQKRAIRIKLNLNETDTTAENLIPIITKASKFFFLNYQIEPRLVFFDDYAKVPAKLWKILSEFGMAFYPNIDRVASSTDSLLLDEVENIESFIDGFKKLGWLQEGAAPENIMPLISSFKAKYGLSEESDWSQKCQNYFDDLIAQVDLLNFY